MGTNAGKRAKLPTYTTPVGIARYPHLNTADTRFNADGEYKVDLRVKAEDAAELIAQLEGIRDEKWATLDAKQKKIFNKAEVFQTEVDDEGNETGYVVFKTKLNAVGTSKETGETWTNEPKLFDSEGNPIPSDVQIWSGSKLIVAGTVNAYAMPSTKLCGVSLKCRGVQVIELVTKGGTSAESFGFKPQAGGYKTEAAEAGLGKQSTAQDGGYDGSDANDGEF